MLLAMTPTFRDDSGGRNAIRRRKGSECIHSIDPRAMAAGRIEVAGKRPAAAVLYSTLRVSVAGTRDGTQSRRYLKAVWASPTQLTGLQLRRGIVSGVHDAPDRNQGHAHSALIPLSMLPLALGLLPGPTSATRPRRIAALPPGLSTRVQITLGGQPPRRSDAGSVPCPDTWHGCDALLSARLPGLSSERAARSAAAVMLRSIG